MTQLLIKELQININNKNNIGYLNRYNFSIKKNYVVKYNYSYSSTSPNPFDNTEANNKNKKARLKIISTLFKLVEILNDKLPLNIFVSVYDEYELNIIKNKKEWVMNFTLLKKIYTESSIKWKTNNNHKENEYRFLLLTLIYERAIALDADALDFCYWLYNQNNDDLYVN